MAHHVLEGWKLCPIVCEALAGGGYLGGIIGSDWGCMSFAGEVVVDSPVLPSWRHSALSDFRGIYGGNLIGVDAPLFSSSMICVWSVINTL